MGNPTSATADRSGPERVEKPARYMHTSPLTVASQLSLSLSLSLNLGLEIPCLIPNARGVYTKKTFPEASSKG